MTKNLKKETAQKKNFLVAFPSVLTIFNLCVGFLSLLASMHGYFLIAGWLIILAAVVDGLDGVMARLTGTSSPFGVELDSLADAVSFAAATSLLFTLWSIQELGRVAVALGFIFLSAGVLRLARYNLLQTKQKNRSFYVGLTVPSASLFVAAIIITFSEPSAHFFYKFFLILMMPLLSFLMVSRIHYPNFIHLLYHRRPNLPRILLTGLILASFYLYPHLSLLVAASVNVSSGPLRDAWRLTQKYILARKKGNEVPWP
jgi:CDP-diacylglycerol--serine O-phosphatidyltransferase